MNNIAIFRQLGHESLVLEASLRCGQYRMIHAGRTSRIIKTGRPVLKRWSSPFQNGFATVNPSNAQLSIELPDACASTTGQMLPDRIRR